MKKSTLYAAYGSNLNLAQMEARCPGARVLGAGRISGYRLAFKRVGVCAFATIEPCQGEYVPVGIWEIGERNEAALDSYEGVPAHYGKETVEVEMAEGKVRGMVYVMNRRAVPALPGHLCYLVFYMPMNVMLYSGYLKNIPIALEEAAFVDGATTWSTYWKIIFPIMTPMHATVAVLTALGTWNDVMTPLVIMSGTGVNTLPLAQLTFQTQFGTNYNLAFASYLLALLPILIFYLVCQKQIINGVVNGAVK